MAIPTELPVHNNNNNNNNNNRNSSKIYRLTQYSNAIQQCATFSVYQKHHLAALLQKFKNLKYIWNKKVLLQWDLTNILTNEDSVWCKPTYVFLTAEACSTLLRSSKDVIREKNSRTHFDRLQNECTNCKGVKNNTNFGQINGIQEKMDTTCK